MKHPSDACTYLHLLALECPSGLEIYFYVSFELYARSLPQSIKEPLPAGRWLPSWLLGRAGPLPFPGSLVSSAD